MKKKGAIEHVLLNWTIRLRLRPTGS